MEPVLGVLAAPAIATALKLANGVADLADRSFASVLEAATARSDQLPMAELASVEGEPSTPTDAAGDLIESALEGVRSILSAVGF